AILRRRESSANRTPHAATVVVRSGVRAGPKRRARASFARAVSTPPSSKNGPAAFHVPVSFGAERLASIDASMYAGPVQNTSGSVLLGINLSGPGVSVLAA